MKNRYYAFWRVNTSIEKNWGFGTGLVPSGIKTTQGKKKLIIPWYTELEKAISVDKCFIPCSGYMVTYADFALEIISVLDDFTSIEIDYSYGDYEVPSRNIWPDLLAVFPKKPIALVPSEENKEFFSKFGVTGSDIKSGDVMVTHNETLGCGFTQPPRSFTIVSEDYKNQLESLGFDNAWYMELKKLNA